MGLRWYTTVIDCKDVAAQGRWWAAALGWKIAYEAADEVVIIPSWVTPERARATPWDEVGPGLVFVPVPEGKAIKNRIHIDLAPHLSDDRDAEIARLLELGATHVDIGQDVGPESEVTWDVLADPEGNEFCVLSSRDS